ncbi:hypothetical protein ACRDNQ_12085 [Palleronia sp. KMU-117]|uniref:hypothetical protein n=1 Tax=Palleronia sp. KMU-117 TaxID=3434108 RepID=UPI003D7460A2
MGDPHIQSFDERLQKIDKRHRQLARGYVMSVNHDGLVIAEPKPQRRSFPWRGTLLILLGLMIFKGFLHFQIGTTAYDERVARLSEGTVIEKVGAYAMTADPVTVWISAQFASLAP